ncbi:MAG: PASTA domain-containing protein [Hamadaea sp.]|uniref:PASTA domain-containing protein n=1 Tax=Hamadaea sp. TaxID=2024425 RepID=UPI00182075F8|nr:PASTA domain-containing protein [Hamadaea sp.]NUR73620.1 PASTA domain-containing protein [Hamadaea sp.]NUT24272.1 PASTA domain-containing protein [Hamadaea sp.]
MRRSLVLLALVGVAAGGCAQPGVQAANAPAPQVKPTDLGADEVRVPDIKGKDTKYALKLIAESRLAAVVRYAPEVLVDAGKVVLSEPKAGVGLGAGDVVVLVVAGRPADIGGFDGHPGAKALTDLAASRSDVFVGAGWDGGNPHKAYVVALGPTADQSAWEERIAAAAGGEAYRVQRCDHSLAQLGGVKAELPDAGLGAYSSFIDPVRCAVVVQGTFTPEQVERVRQRWGTAVVLLSS